MKIGFLTNILTPYRINFYDQLQEELQKQNGEIRVFVMTDKLPMRPWSYSDFKRNYTELLKGKKVIIKGNDYLINQGIIRQIKKFNPDVLIIAGSWTYPSFCIAAFSKEIKKNCKRLLWTESHNHTGIDNKSKSNKAVKILKRHILKQFDGFCVPGKYALETLSSIIDIDKKAIVNLPNLIDNDYYEVANEMRKNRVELRKLKNLSDNTFVFFTPASLYSLKGHIPFFSNVGEVVRGKDVVFVLAGEGPDKQKIIELTEKLGIQTIACGYQSQDQIREWLALSDVFLLPSLSDANPLSNIEAAWAGLPLCVSCYVGNAPELVDDKENGVVFDTLNKDSVEEKIEFIVSQDKEWLQNAGRISHEKARKGFMKSKETITFIDSVSSICNIQKCESRR